MEFYRRMLCNFFDINHLFLDLLDVCEEIDEDRTLNFVLETLNELKDEEIKEFCIGQGMNEQEIKLCLSEIRNGV